MGLLQVWIGGFPACLDLGILANLDLEGLCKSGVDTGTVTTRQKTSRWHSAKIVRYSKTSSGKIVVYSMCYFLQ